MSWKRSVNKDDLHPGLVAVIKLMLRKLEDDGGPFKVYSGLRTFAEQNELYAKGRTTGGNIVTKARGGQSMHNYGLAVDLAPFNLMTPAEWDLHWPDPTKVDGQAWYDMEGALTEAAAEIDMEGDDGVDYEWGGRWKFRDTPHIQVRTTVRELRSGYYPHCNDMDWLIHAHTTFLFDTPWMSRRVQYMLNEQSYSAGGVDGVFGTNSLIALNAFQEDRGIEPKNIFTEDDVEALLRLHQEAELTASLPADLTLD